MKKITSLLIWAFLLVAFQTTSFAEAPTSYIVKKSFNRNLELVINGPGFFEIRLPDGTVAFTRNGSFVVNRTTGLLKTRKGNLVLPGITVPANATALKVPRDGIVLATLPETAAPIVCGQFFAVVFAHSAKLKAIGNDLYRSTSAAKPGRHTLFGSPGAGTLSVRK